MKATRLSILAITLCALSACAQFTAGNLAVVHVGDGTTVMNGLGNNVAIDEYSVLGSLVQSFAIPQAATPFSMTGNATAEGALSRSGNGTSLTFAGYRTDRLASGSLAGSTAAAVNRTVGEISYSGALSFPIISATAFSANSHRTAVTDGAGNYWSAGVGQGVTYMGSGTEAVIEIAQATLRVMNTYNGNLYFTAAQGLFVVTGQPQSGTATPATFISTAGTGVGTASSYDFAFNANGTVAYISDDRTTANGGGIQRWDFNGTAWALSYTLNPGSGTRGLAVDFDTSTIYATTAETSNNRLVRTVDVGAASAFTDLAFAGATRAFRGLDFAPVPEPATYVLAGLGIAALLIFRRRK